jgi:tetratricopeptide (TPR) repeat protein
MLFLIGVLLLMLMTYVSGCNSIPVMQATNTITNTPEPTFTQTITKTPEPTSTETPIPPTPVPTKSPSEWMEIGRTAFAQDDFVSAIDAFTQAILQDQELVEGYYLRGLSFASLGNYEQAVADFTLTITLDEEHAEAYNARGEVYFLLQRKDLALEDFIKAIELSPTLPTAYLNRAKLQKGAWLPEAVILDLEVYLALEPEAEDREEVESMIAELTEEIERLEQAELGLPFIDDFSRATTWFGNAPTGTDEIIGGTIYYENGQLGIQVVSPDTLVWARPGLQFKDVSIEVDAHRVGGTTNNIYGIICRYVSYTNFYAFIVTSDGYVGIARAYAGGLDEDAAGVEALQYKDIVKVGKEVNHLRAICSGKVLKLYVNGKAVAYGDGSAISYGDVGLFVGSMDRTQGADVLFDNFEVRIAPDEP